MNRSKYFLATMMIVFVVMSSCTRKNGLGCPTNFGKVDKPKTEQKNV